MDANPLYKCWGACSFTLPNNERLRNWENHHEIRKAMSFDVGLIATVSMKKTPANWLPVLYFLSFHVPLDKRRVTDDKEHDNVHCKDSQREWQ